jgi:cell division septal protein FtsQ
VYISGQYNMQASEITEALALRQGEPIMDISLNELKDKVEALGWVREATIERQLPGTLHVRIVERRPVAIWQNQGELRLVDIEGKIITKGVEGAKENFGNLPIVVGENANEHVSLVFGFLMKEPELFMLVSSVIRVGDRRWNVRLKNGMEIKLPEKKPDAAEGRYVVQVGAYVEAAKLREARQKVESLGFKTYTQVVGAKDAQRTRVRIGPFANKAEAQKAADKIKKLSLPAAILEL